MLEHTVAPRLNVAEKTLLEPLDPRDHNAETSFASLVGTGWPQPASHRFS